MRLAWSVPRAQPESSLPASVSGHAPDPVTPQELFVALDGRGIAAAGDRYRIEVFSVRDEAGNRWVQLTLAGDRARHMLTLRLRTGDNTQHAIFALSAWLADPAASADIFNVA